MNDMLDALKRMGDTINILGARLGGFAVVESSLLKPGETYVDKTNRYIYVYKPTEIQRIVRLGIREAHPWIRDPLDPFKMIR